MLRETLLPLAEKQDQARAFVEMLGLDNATALIDATGLDEAGMVTKTLLALDGEPTPSR